MSELVTCETVVAVVLHARKIGDRPIHLGGHRTPAPQTLCGKSAAWDTRRPIAGVTCMDCQAALTAPPATEPQGKSE